MFYNNKKGIKLPIFWHAQCCYLYGSLWRILVNESVKYKIINNRCGCRVVLTYWLITRATGWMGLSLMYYYTSSACHVVAAAVDRTMNLLVTPLLLGSVPRPSTTANVSVLVISYYLLFFYLTTWPQSPASRPPVLAESVDLEPLPLTFFPPPKWHT